MLLYTLLSCVNADAIRLPLDRNAPSVPSNVETTAVLATQIDLSWTSSTDNVGVKGYKIFRDGAQIATVSTNAFSNSGLKASTSYSYTISAFDRAGNNSARTGIITVKTLDSTSGESTSGQSSCNVNMANFKLTGDPNSNGGASWSYVSTDGGVSFNIKGILYKPTGSGPFPGIVLSHGKGGTAPADAAQKFKDWGVVAIATNYTHSSDTSGLPTGEDGASTANIQRAHKTWDILCGLGYVKMNKVAAHGHSMGAFVTAALVGTYANDFAVASHTAGGVSDNKSPTWTSSAQAKGIKVPYQMHHGDNDTIVPLVDDENFDDILTANNIDHQLLVYPGYTHPDVRTDPEVLETVKNWYSAKGFFDP
jgi:dienelactone hydrolase